MQVLRRLWLRPGSVFTAGYLAVWMRQWISSLRETSRMTRTFIAVITGKGIVMERGISAGKKDMAAQAARAAGRYRVYLLLEN